MSERRLPDLAAMRAFAAELAGQLGPGRVLALDGPLGAGKTTLVRDLVAAAGGDPALVASPTFGLLHHYQTARWPVIHVDAYRLGDADELLAIGFDELADEGVACVEWAERAAEALHGRPGLHVRLAHLEGGGRSASMHGLTAGPESA